MHLTDTMRVELERRLAVTATEQADDPAFRDLPAGDLIVLLVLVAIAVIGVFILQAG